MITLFLGFCLFTHNAQAQEPTKQETMDWIAGKMKDNIAGVGNSFVSYQSGIFIYYTKGTYYGEDYPQQFKINFNFVKSREYSQCGKFTGPHVGAIMNIYLDERFYTEVDEFDFSKVIPINTDPSLCERFQKAVDLLIKYNTQKAAGEKF